jgi:hypothetical protein
MICRLLMSNSIFSSLTLLSAFHANFFLTLS